MPISANEISREALSYLAKNWPEPCKFNDMVKALKIDAKDLSKNLFYLEEHRLVKLSTSLPPGSTFPVIVMVRLTPEGEEIAAEKTRLERRFPVTKPPVNQQGISVTYRRVLERLRDKIETKEALAHERRNDLLRAIDELLALDWLDEVFPE